ncbi:hypothetical protein, partial [uncultured Dialister sp.]|uniref:hypothetical protein n=1 Tax=uncultured Dialister sp. TaxID=278064 RepID=UPI00265FB6E2
IFYDIYLSVLTNPHHLLLQSKVKGILPCLKRKVLVPPKGPVLHCLFILTIKKPVIAHGLF